MDDQQISSNEHDLLMLKKRARRRLMGAVALSVVAVCFLPVMFHPPVQQRPDALAFVIHYPYGNVCSYVRDWERSTAVQNNRQYGDAPAVHSVASRPLTLKPTGHEHTLLVTPAIRH